MYGTMTVEDLSFNITLTYMYAPRLLDLWTREALSTSDHAHATPFHRASKKRRVPGVSSILVTRFIFI